MISESIQFRDIIRISLMAVAGLIVIMYILFQARFLVIGPQITLSKEIPLQQNERFVTLTGKATNISRLWLNGRPIFTDPKGDFAAAVVLENGYTIAKLEAEDRYGRRTSLSREFVYTPMNFVTSQ